MLMSGPGQQAARQKEDGSGGDEGPDRDRGRLGSVLDGASINLGVDENCTWSGGRQASHFR